MDPNDKITNLSSYLVLLDLPGNIPGEKRSQNLRRGRKQNQKSLRRPKNFDKPVILDLNFKYLRFWNWKCQNNYFLFVYFSALTIKLLRNNESSVAGWEVRVMPASNPFPAILQGRQSLAEVCELTYPDSYSHVSGEERWDWSRSQQCVAGPVSGRSPSRLAALE